MEGREILKKLKGYHDLPIEIQSKLEHVYIQTTMLINEMINLESEQSDSGLIKLKEPRSRRKDRYSSVAYGNYIATLLEREYLSKNSNNIDDYFFFMQAGF
jgi:hypothetical protein